MIVVVSIMCNGDVTIGMISVAIAMLNRTTFFNGTDGNVTVVTIK